MNVYTEHQKQARAQSERDIVPTPAYAAGVRYRELTDTFVIPPGMTREEFLGLMKGYNNG